VINPELSSQNPFERWLFLKINGCLTGETNLPAGKTFPWTEGYLNLRTIYLSLKYDLCFDQIPKFNYNSDLIREMEKDLPSMLETGQNFKDGVKGEFDKAFKAMAEDLKRDLGL
jgi:hypothetical protein